MGSCRKRIEVANSESKERIEFFSVHLWGGRQQNNFSFWNDRYPFQLYLWMSFLSDFFSLMLLVRWIVFQFAKWLCWLWKLFVLPPKARGKKQHSPILISVGSTYSRFPSHKCKGNITAWNPRETKKQTESFDLWFAFLHLQEEWLIATRGLLESNRFWTFA